MLNHLPAPILLDISILATAPAWGLGFFIASRRVYLFSALAIGCFFVILGWSTASLGAPPWLVIALPTATDFLLLWYIMRTPRKMAIAYASTWTIYIAFHIALSATLHYDDLIPPWRLHA
jgi:hypothetical protein